MIMENLQRKRTQSEAQVTGNGFLTLNLIEYIKEKVTDGKRDPEYYREDEHVNALWGGQDSRFCSTS
jgi:hypothetical protein